jgi:hypothetical protein
MLTANDFRMALNQRMNNAFKTGIQYVDIGSREVHLALGDYPNPTTHRMPVLCQVVRSELTPSDVILHQPPRGKGASLKIRYALPRP